MNQSNCRHLSGALDKQTLDELLPAGLTLKSMDLQQGAYVLLDDHDWDIHRAGYSLLRDEQDLWRLLDARDNCPAQCRTKNAVRFWWDCPAGKLAEMLQKIISVRALLPRYKFGLTVESLVVVNADDKTVVRLERRSIAAGNGPEQHFYRLEALRGYMKEYALVRRLMSAQAGTDVETLSLGTLLTYAGFEVVIPESKPVFDLADDETAESAVTRMAARMIQLARHQEPGLIADIDTEFVHQYRVNLRKTRSLISLFKKTLAPQKLAGLKAELKTITGSTNELRDLDVFILDRDYYRSLLPENLWPGFEQLFRQVKRRRGHAHKKVAAFLGGEDYLEKVGFLLRSLQSEPEFIGQQARHEIKPLVGRKIMRQYRLIQSAGDAIDRETPDAAVHELRIECKKLRYLLELFAELFPRDKLKVLIRDLKVLQDNLGRFNDFSVQREFLQHFGRGKSITPEQSASMIGLEAVLYNKQGYERSQVMDNIGAFIAPAVRNHFEELFQDKEPG